MRKPHIVLIGFVATGLMATSPAARAETVSVTGAVSSMGNLMMIPVTYTCVPVDNYKSLTASAQNVTNGTMGYGQSTATCDDTLQWAFLTVTGAESHAGDVVNYIVTAPGGTVASGTATMS